MSHPHVEQPMPDPDPAWLRRFEAKMAELDAARRERAAEREQDEQ